MAVVSRRPVALALVVVTLAACGPTQTPSAIDRLAPCSGDDAPTDAYCGTLTVFENRDTRQGRQLDLNIIVLPALSPDSKPDPLFFLAGGPGQGAAQISSLVRDLFRRVQTDRDIVLVDQRGTGRSNPLNCESTDDSLAIFNEPEEVSFARLKTCMSGYDADLTQYTTTIAMDDLDDVRAYLGYEQINIYGGSYGTRAGLVYLRRHGDHVRTAVLDGVAPTDMGLPLYFPRDVQRALDLLIDDCANDTPCRATYPDLGPRIHALMDRLERNPPLVAVTHPRTGERGEIRFEARLLANVIAGTLYSPMVSALIPAVIERAAQNDFQGMLALASIGDTGGPSNMSIGMQLSVICAEDAPRVMAADAERESAGTLFGEHVMRSQRLACEFWPKGAVAEEFYEPVRSTVPTLVMSGALDPVTPPGWGEQVAAHLPASTHVVIPGTGHTAGATGCGIRIIRAFIDAGTVDGLDTTCVAGIRRPPFFVSPAGPDPTQGRSEAAR